MESDSHSLPMAAHPREPLKDGLVSFMDECRSGHAIEKVTQNSDSATRANLQEKVYGSALPARAAIEQQLLNRFERLPGLPSSKLGLESLTGDLDHFGFESYLPSMEEKTNVLEEPHPKMERKLGL